VCDNVCVSQSDPHTGVEHLEVAFEFRKLRFTYHADNNTFERLRFPVHEPFEYYLKASGYGTADKVAAAAQQWGLNQFEVSSGSCQMSAACLPEVSCLHRLHQG